MTEKIWTITKIDVNQSWWDKLVSTGRRIVHIGFCQYVDGYDYKDMDGEVKRRRFIMCRVCYKRINQFKWRKLTPKQKEAHRKLIRG